MTPTSYLELLATFARLLKARKEKISNNIKRYERGVQKIIETEGKVGEM